MILLTGPRGLRKSRTRTTFMGIIAFELKVFEMYWAVEYVTNQPWPRSLKWRGQVNRCMMKVDAFGQFQGSTPRTEYDKIRPPMLGDWGTRDQDLGPGAAARARTSGSVAGLFVAVADSRLTPFREAEAVAVQPGRRAYRAWPLLRRGSCCEGTGALLVTRCGRGSRVFGR